jgi:hypothetical protein
VDVIRLPPNKPLKLTVGKPRLQAPLADSLVATLLGGSLAASFGASSRL